MSQSNIEIAQAAQMRPIQQIAAGLGIPDDALEPYGRHKAKIALSWLAGLADRPDGKLILVTAVSPTPAGEGKTTTTVGLGDALTRIGERAMICLREPALGPVFGMKGGAAGGGYAQVVPMEDINLHFTGDFAAIARCDEPARRADRQSHPSRQCARHRRAAHHVAPRARCERPRAARHRGGPRRPRQRLSAGVGLRHRRRERGDGGVLPVPPDLADLRRATGRDHHRIHARPSARARAAARCTRRDDRPAARRAGTEPRADPRAHARLRARRSVREHRARLQLARGDARRPEARRLRRDRSRLRLRPGCREVRRHPVPGVGAPTFRRGDRRDRASDEVPRRDGCRRPARRECRGDRTGLGQSPPAPRDRPARRSASRRSSRSTTGPRTPTPRSRRWSGSRSRPELGRSSPVISRRAVPEPRSSPARWCGSPTSRPSCGSPTPTTRRSGRR